MIILKEAISDYLAYCEYQKKLSAKSIKAYTIDLKQLRHYIMSEDVPVKAEISAYITHLHRTYSPRTVKRKIAILELLFATGLRVSELCSLNKEYIDLGDGKILIMGKGAKERILQIGNHEVLSILRRYAEEDAARIHKTGWFFVNRLSSRISEQSVRFLIKRLCAKANIEQNITPHMFRHSFATLLLEEDVDIRYIQRMLGHSSILTTQIYTQVTVEKQRQILTVKHPRNKIVVNL